MGASNAWVACPYCNDATALTIDEEYPNAIIFSLSCGTNLHLSGTEMPGHVAEGETIRARCMGCDTCFTVDVTGRCTDIDDPEGICADHQDEWDACDPECPGWFTGDDQGHPEPEGKGWEALQRCDDCNRYRSDDHAAWANFQEVTLSYLGPDACPSYITWARKPRGLQHAST
jgi:hypothetical protein